ncbi:hypothetical protein U1Q18_052257 [Sarracenia purpurea var. burkii]
MLGWYHHPAAERTKVFLLKSPNFLIFATVALFSVAVLCVNTFLRGKDCYAHDHAGRVARAHARQPVHVAVAANRRLCFWPDQPMFGVWLDTDYAGWQPLYEYNATALISRWMWPGLEFDPALRGQRVDTPLVPHGVSRAPHSARRGWRTEAGRPSANHQHHAAISELHLHLTTR